MAVAIDEEVAKYIIWILYFVGLYFTFFWMSVLIFEDEDEGKRDIKRWPKVTIILPIYNEEKYIEWTLRSVFDLDYPKDKLNVIAVNDGSKDNSLKILKKLQKEFDFTIINKKNGGKYTALNAALKITDTPYFACLDADCYVEKDSLKEIIKEFDKPNVAAVMPIMKVYKPTKLIQRVQWLEYILNIYYKYIFGKLDCIHVTPGPFSTYRTKIVKKLGNFKKAHLTEDLEMALRIQAENKYKIKQSLSAIVYTASPKNLKAFVSQRTRWYQGTVYNILDYKHIIFNKEFEDFGMFYLPMVAFTGFLLVLGTFVVIYLFLRNFYHMIKRMILTHFDFATYISSWHWNFSLLDLNWQVLFASFIMFFLLFTLIYLSFLSTKERVNLFKNIKLIIMFMYYFLIYRFILAYVWVKVIWKVIKKKANVWEKVN